MKTTRVLGMFAAAAALLVCAKAQTFVLLEKADSFLQTGTSSATQVAGTPWTFTAAISGNTVTPSYPATPNRITLPSSGPVYNLVDPVTNGSGEWRYRPTGFSSLGLLNASYPDGQYTYEFNGNTWTPTLSSGSFALNPAIAITNAGTWSGNTLFLTPLEASNTFTVSTSWSVPDGFVSGMSRVGIFVDHNSGPDSFSGAQDDNGSSNFTTNSATVNITGGTFLAGNTYFVGLELNQFLAAPDTSYSGFTAVSINTVNTTFFIQVGSPIPEPSTYAAIFGAVALAGVMIHRRRRLA